MADKGRDLKVSVLSDADQFDLAKPADDLDHLGDAARDASRDLTGAASDVAQLGTDATGAARDVERLADSGDQLRDLGTDAERAGADVKGLGKDVDAAAAQVDGAFDKIAAASKRSSSQVDASAEKGGQSLREMGDEGQGTARELAASFDGTADGIADGMQEAATNVLAVLGPIGAGVGVAAGLGLGFLRGKAEQLKETISGLVGVLIDANGQLDRSTVVDQLRTLAEDGTITELATEARAGKVDVADYLRALAGDPEALRRTRDAIDAQRAAIDQATLAEREAGAVTVESANARQDQIIALVNMRDNLDETAQKWGLAAEAVAAYQQAAEPVPAVIQEHADALAGFVEPTSVYTGLLDDAMAKEQEAAQHTADKTKDQSDSWEDYAKDVEVSVTDYLAELERQVTAQENWSANLGKLARRGVEDGVLAELQRMGPEGAPLVAKLTTASDAELAKLVALYARRGKASTDELESALANGRAGVGQQAGSIWQTAQSKLSPPIVMTSTLTGPPPGQAAAIRRDVQNNMRPVEVPVMLRQVPASTWSRFVP